MSTIMCDECLESINFNEDDFDHFEYEQEDTMGIIDCPHCNTKLSVYYTMRINYSTRKSNEEEILKLYDLD